ncbi:MAG TPA: hypothetical protein VFL96_04580 [Acidobacteriaceae bacterium]|nr:hypothetical protein [Acidobacteriaceae bacterium]
MKHAGGGSRVVPPAVRLACIAGLAVILIQACALGQDATPGTIKDGYEIHQSFDLGGHIADYSGSGAMYATLVNLRSGPRILNQNLNMHAIGKSKFPLFDDLMTNSTGYGGDPSNVTVFQMSKGKLYDFRGLFRRDRQYFDYNLLANPLVPAGVSSNGYTFPQVNNSPHLFNTVRRMTDTNLTLFPSAQFSFHAGYSQNIMQGPTFGTIHTSAEALLEQQWRNSTDTWRGGVDWKILSRTTLTFDEVITHYKGDTFWQLTGLNLQLSDGTPVTLGFDNIKEPSCADHAPAISSGTTNPPTANPTCNGYLQYSRSQPTRTLFPTEIFRFQSANVAKVQMNGRISYTGANMALPSLNEFFAGRQAVPGTPPIREFSVTGKAKAQRINVSADFGLAWQVSRKVTLIEQYDFWDFRQPGVDNYTQISFGGNSMLAPPSTTGTTSLTNDAFFMGQKTEVNTIEAEWEAMPRVSLSLGYRYRLRDIVYRNPDTNYIPVREHGGLFGVVLRPSHNWKVNGNVEIAYADNTFMRISPRQLQHYQVRTTYRADKWGTIFAAFNDLERRNNVAFVHHLDHSRAFAAGADLTPGEHYGVELGYGYTSLFTQTDECYASTPAGPITTTSPACIANGTPYYSPGYFSAPTQYGSVGLMLMPYKWLRTSAGYRMSAVNGTATRINPRQVPGSLQSQYQSPYASVAWTMHKGLIWKGDWDYYGYGEGTPVGPTLPRSFRGNIYTVGMHYEF